MKKGKNIGKQMMNFLNFRGKVAYNSVGVNELSFCLSWVGEGGGGRGEGNWHMLFYAWRFCISFFDHFGPGGESLPQFSQERRNKVNEVEHSPR